MEIIAEFEECPDCHIDARLMNSIVQEEISKGNIGDDAVASTKGAIFSNVDPRKPPLVGGRIPSARVFYDICTKCGKEYIVRIERGHVTIPSNPNMMPDFS